MNFCRDKCDDGTMMNIVFFVNWCRSVQTSYVVLSCTKNRIQKGSIFMMLRCTNIVLQNCDASSASSSSSKHHFSKFFPRLFHWCNKEGTIDIVCYNWKSVVFGNIVIDWNQDNIIIHLLWSAVLLVNHLVKINTGTSRCCHNINL